MEGKCSGEHREISATPITHTAKKKSIQEIIFCKKNTN